MYHKPVLLTEAVDFLITNPDGIYVDATFGGGGHSQKILENLSPKGKLFSFDKDSDTQKNAEKIQDDRFRFIPSDFRYFNRHLHILKIKKVEGILVDLGISSHQIDCSERGFSIREGGNLDMRMNQEQENTAAHLLNTLSQENLQQIFSEYGELFNSKTLSQAIVRQRLIEPFSTIETLKKIGFSHAPKHKEFRYLAQLFQAIRIAVNDELGALKEFLEHCPDTIKPKGRLVIISFHSLEDRLVKDFMKTGNFEGELKKDVFGHFDKPFQMLHSKPQTPSEVEINENPRARSAKMRIGERT